MITLEAQKPAQITVPLLQGNTRSLSFVFQIKDIITDTFVNEDLTGYDEIKMAIRDRVNVNVKPFEVKSSLDNSIEILGTDNHIARFTLDEKYWQSQNKTWYSDMLFYKDGKYKTRLSFKFPVDLTVTGATTPTVS